MAFLIVFGIIAVAILISILVGCWRVKPPRPCRPPERFLFISIDGIAGPKTPFRNEDQS